MNATEFFESQLITDSNSVIDKMKHKFSKHDLIKFADAYASQQEVVSKEDIKWLKEANESLIYARPHLTHISYPNHNLVEKLSKWMPKKKCQCSVDISDEDDDVILCGDCYLDATNGKTD